MRIPHSVFSAHLTDHELGIAADQVRSPGMCPFLKLIEVSEQEDQGLVLRDVVAPEGAGGSHEVRHFAYDAGFAFDERSAHRSLRPELISGAGAIEVTSNPRFVGCRHRLGA
jgi:hypothetical protein